MIIGMIIAGDGEVEACVPFDNREEAEALMKYLLLEYYDESFDRVVITATMTYKDTVHDLDQSTD